MRASEQTHQKMLSNSETETLYYKKRGAMTVLHRNSPHVQRRSYVTSSWSHLSHLAVLNGDWKLVRDTHADDPDVAQARDNGRTDSLSQLLGVALAGVKQRQSHSKKMERSSAQPTLGGGVDCTGEEMQACRRVPQQGSSKGAAARVQQGSR